MKHIASEEMKTFDQEDTLNRERIYREMVADKERESAADEWSEDVIRDLNNAI